MGYSNKTNKPADNGGKTTVDTPSSRRPFRVRPLAIAAIVVILASIAFLVVRRGTGNDWEQRTTDKVKKVQRLRPARTSQTTQQPSTNRTAKANADNKAEKPEKPPFVKRPGAMQLPDGRVLTFAPPKEGEFRIVHSHGSMYKCDHLGNWVDVTPKPIFDNSFEETLVGMATTGNFIPGMLMGIDYDTAIKMLTKPVVINEGDSEDVIAKKEAVAQAKEAILDYMKDGASLDEFVMEMRKQVVKEKFIRGMALKEIVASLKEGRVQDAADMRDAANKMLEKDSLPALKLPAHIENAIKENK